MQKTNTIYADHNPGLSARDDPAEVSWSPGCDDPGSTPSVDDREAAAIAAQQVIAGDTHAFYTSSAWLKKRAKVLEDNHYECNRCKAKGIYSRATTVHHVERLRRAPCRALDYSNLEPLCDACHWLEHHPQPEPLTPERW